MGGQVLVGGAEVSVAEESAMCAERGGMRRGEDEVARVVDVTAFSDGVGPPEHEDEAVAAAVEGVDGGVGERLPADGGVRAWLVGTDGEGGVEQKHSLACPSAQVAVGRDGCAGLDLDGGMRTPGLTEKARPLAWPGPW